MVIRKHKRSSAGRSQKVAHFSGSNPERFMEEDMLCNLSLEGQTGSMEGSTRKGDRRGCPRRKKQLAKAQRCKSQDMLRE